MFSDGSDKYSKSGFSLVPVLGMGLKTESRHGFYFYFFSKFWLEMIIKFSKNWQKYMKKKRIAHSIYLLITHFSDSGT